MQYHFTVRCRSFALQAHHNKPAPRTFAGVEGTEPPLSKQRTISSDVKCTTLRVRDYNLGYRVCRLCYRLHRAVSREDVEEAGEDSHA